MDRGVENIYICERGIMMRRILKALLVLFEFCFVLLIHPRIALAEDSTPTPEPTPSIAISYNIGTGLSVNGHISETDKNNTYSGFVISAADTSCLSSEETISWDKTTFVGTGFNYAIGEKEVIEKLFKKSATLSETLKFKATLKKKDGSLDGTYTNEANNAFTIYKFELKSSSMGTTSIVKDDSYTTGVISSSNDHVMWGTASDTCKIIAEPASSDYQFQGWNVQNLGFANETSSIDNPTIIQLTDEVGEGNSKFAKVGFYKEVTGVTATPTTVVSGKSTPITISISPTDSGIENEDISWLLTGEKNCEITTTKNGTGNKFNVSATGVVGGSFNLKVTVPDYSSSSTTGTKSYDIPIKVSPVAQVNATLKPTSTQSDPITLNAGTPVTLTVENLPTTDPTKYKVIWLPDSRVSLSSVTTQNTTGSVSTTVDVNTSSKTVKVNDVVQVQAIVYYNETLQISDPLTAFVKIASVPNTPTTTPDPTGDLTITRTKGTSTTNDYTVIQSGSGQTLTLSVDKSASDTDYGYINWSASPAYVTFTPTRTPQDGTATGKDTLTTVVSTSGTGTGIVKVTANGFASGATSASRVGSTSLVVADIIGEPTSIAPGETSSKLTVEPGTTTASSYYSTITWSLASQKTGVSINSATGEVTVGTGVSKGTEIQILATLKNDKGTTVGVLSTDLITVSASYVVSTNPSILTYITTGYTRTATASVYPKTDISEYIWDISENPNVSKISLDPSKKKKNRGLSKTVTIKAEGPGRWTYDNVDEDNIDEYLSSLYVMADDEVSDDLYVEVYPKPSLSMSKNSSTVTLTGTLPDKVHTDKADIEDVTGGYYVLMQGDSQLYSTSATRSSTSSATSQAINIPITTINSSMNSKSSGSEIKARVYPIGSGASSTSAEIYGEAGPLEVGTVVVSGPGIVSRTYYGVEGSTTSITASSSASPFRQWYDGTTSASRTITFGNSSTTLSATAGASSSSMGSSMTNTTSMTTTPVNAAGDAGGTGGNTMDAVPKTGEGNRFLYIMLAMVVCAGIAAVYMFKAMRSGTEKAGDMTGSVNDLSDETDDSRRDID